MAPSSKRFPDVASDINFPRDEERILRFWKANRIFEQTLEHRKGNGKAPFVFYEGPPTANGMPHNGHVLTRAIKDLFPRYQTMRGHHVPRKAGWDTHGLPVETEVEKDLRIHGKAAIEAYGVEPFTEKCIESVFRYTTEWERLTERIGFWVDQEDAYVTFHRSYVESVWWALSELFKKGLLYRGHKVVWWWAQGGTALSSAEVGWGYKTVDDPSAFVAFPLIDKPAGLEGEAQLLVWTTTPWTLPSNMYAAVKADAKYVLIEREGAQILVADALADELAKKLKGTRKEGGPSWTGAELAGLRYQPPFDLYAAKHSGDATASGKLKYWVILVEDFVTLDSGTGIVHIAPAFGEDDHRAFTRRQRDLGEELELFCAVNPDGTFVPELTQWAGKWVKGADDEIALDLKQRGLLLLKEQYRHQYPFCWRSDKDPLIQYARPAWYVRTTSRIGDAMANNEQIGWYPEHIKEGRFGDFLRNNVDWALSRERYWGSPLPVWENPALDEEHPDRFVVISGLPELRSQKNNNLAAIEAELAEKVTDKDRAHHLLVHKPWIDRVTFEREGVEGTYRRVSEVIDVWFDSGCMPFAQWGFPHADGSHEKLREAFPADFISEAIDQTRGWFYSLLMVSTLVFDEKKRAELGLRAGGEEYPHPYKKCIVLGHVCDREGVKESKGKGNYTPPEVILEQVKLEFGVVEEAGAEEGGGKGAKAQKGVVLIAREDLEGLDLQEGAKVSLYRGDAKDKTLTLEIRVAKGMKRRIALLHADDRAALSLSLNEKGGKVAPVEVPRLSLEQRVTIEDPSTPAPGADAFRWFFYSASPPWTNTRHSLTYVRTAQKDFVIKLRNVYSFFTIYANIDAWTPELSAPPREERPLIDRWILSELAATVREVSAQLDNYGVYDAAQKLLAFVESLSNWYVRRSRERFWGAGVGEEMGEDKRAAYATLYTCLLETSRLIAPFVPFFAEDLYLGLTGGKAQASVHLEDYPEADLSALDETLSLEMAAVRELVSLGLQVRTGAKQKVRQPLRRTDVVLSKPELAARIEPHLDLLREELNVREVVLLPPGSEGAQVKYRLKPNFRVMGPKVGKKVQLVKQLLEKADAGAMRAELVTAGNIKLDLDGEVLTLTGEDIEIAVEAAEGFAAAGGRVGVVVLHTALDQDLLDEGFSRELQSKLQGLRREAGLGFTDRVQVAIEGSERVARVIGLWGESLKANVLIDTLSLGAPAFSSLASAEANIDDEPVKLSLAKALAKARSGPERGDGASPHHLRLIPSGSSSLMPSPPPAAPTLPMSKAPRWARRGPAVAALGALLLAMPWPVADARADLFDVMRLAADTDDDDHDGTADGQQATAAGDAARDAIDLPPGLSGALSLDPPDLARLLRAGRPIASGTKVGPRDKLQVQGQRPGRVILKAAGKDGWALTLGIVEARFLDSDGAAVDPVRSGVELVRTPPTRLPEDPFSPVGENSFRALLIGVAADIEGSASAVSIATDGRIIDGLALTDLRDVPCPSDVAEGLVCRSSLPLRFALDQTDRAHPVAAHRSIQAELGGAVAIMLGSKKLTHARVVGPRQTQLGDIERFRARTRIFLVRDRIKGTPPFGVNDQIAISLARAQLARANAIWGQCGISFGPVNDAEIKVVDPPPPTMLAVGCDLGLPAEGGQLRMRVDGREVTVELLPGESPRAVARKTAKVLEARGFRATVSDNLRIGPGVDATSDVVVRRRDGASVVIEPPTTGKVSSDPQMNVCIGSVDLTDGLQHFTDVDAVAGTVEERALLRAFDDGDSRTIEVVLVPSFATGGRIGESFIRGDRSSLGNMVIEDRAGVRADNLSYALAHELGHVLLDVPGHSDDFGQDTPSRLMDSDAADPSAFGPRRLIVDECVRAIRQSGPKAPTPLLVPWPLERLPFRHTP